jgi:hypothetical protein
MTDPHFFRADLDAINILRRARNKLLDPWRAGGRYDGPPLSSDDHRAFAVLASAITYLAGPIRAKPAS